MAGHAARGENARQPPLCSRWRPTCVTLPSSTPDAGSPSCRISRRQNELNSQSARLNARFLPRTPFQVIAVHAADGGRRMTWIALTRLCVHGRIDYLWLIIRRATVRLAGAFLLWDTRISNGGNVMPGDGSDRHDPQMQCRCDTTATLTLGTLTLIFASAVLVPGAALSAGPMGRTGAPMMAPSPGVAPAPKAPAIAPQAPAVGPHIPAPVAVSPGTAAPVTIFGGTGTETVFGGSDGRGASHNLSGAVPASAVQGTGTASVTIGGSNQLSGTGNSTVIASGGDDRAANNTASGGSVGHALPVAGSNTIGGTTGVATIGGTTGGSRSRR